MTGKIYLVLTILIVIIIACNELEVSEYTDWPIIESYLKPGDYFNMKITRQNPFSSNVQYSLDNINTLVIKVQHNNTIYTLTPLGDGQYIDSSLVVSEREQYNITFYFNSKEISAYTNIPSKPLNFTESVTQIYVPKMDSTSGPPSSMTMAEPVQLKWTNSDASYYLVVIENIETNPEAIFDFGDKPPGNRFRKQPVNSSGLEIRSQEFQYFGMHRLILFHVLPDYAALYNQTSSSSQNLTNPATSITNGYGIFTGLNSDTLYIKVKKQ